MEGAQTMFNTQLKIEHAQRLSFKEIEQMYEFAKTQKEKYDSETFLLIMDDTGGIGTHLIIEDDVEPFRKNITDYETW